MSARNKAGTPAKRSDTKPEDSNAKLVHNNGAARTKTTAAMFRTGERSEAFA